MAVQPEDVGLHPEHLVGQDSVRMFGKHFWVKVKIGSEYPKKSPSKGNFFCKYLSELVTFKAKTTMTYTASLGCHVGGDIVTRIEFFLMFATLLCQDTSNNFQGFLETFKGVKVPFQRITSLLS